MPSTQDSGKPRYLSGSDFPVLTVLGVDLVPPNLPRMHRAYKVSHPRSPVLQEITWNKADSQSQTISNINCWSNPDAVLPRVYIYTHHLPLPPSLILPNPSSAGRTSRLQAAAAIKQVPVGGDGFGGMSSGTRKGPAEASVLCMAALVALLLLTSPSAAAGRVLKEGGGLAGGYIDSLLALLPKGGSGPGPSGCTGGPVNNGGTCP